LEKSRIDVLDAKLREKLKERWKDFYEHKVALILLRVKCLQNDNRRNFLLVVFPQEQLDELPSLIIYFDNKCALCGSELIPTKKPVKCTICGEIFEEGEKLVCLGGHHICDKCYEELVEKPITLLCLDALVANKEIIRELSKEDGYAMAVALVFYELIKHRFENTIDFVFFTGSIIPEFSKVISNICLEQCEGMCSGVMDLLKSRERKTVIYFKSKKALDCLLKNGEVYTIRPKKRFEGLAYVKTSKKGRKLAEVEVKYVGEVVQTAPDDEWFVVEGAYAKGKLEEFVDKSGFNSVEEWLEEVRKLNGGKLPDKMFLYHVKLLEEDS